MNFPSQVLKPQHKVLSLFCAAFGGQQDVRFIHEAGVKDCTLVDYDAEKLATVTYPYRKVCGDCFEFIELAYHRGEKYDVIVSDHWTNQDTEIHWRYFDKLRKMAPVLILGICQVYLDTLPERPEGEYFKRSAFRGGIYWRLIQDK